MADLREIPLVILDTDPGGDDAFALLWLASLHHQGVLKLLAVTTAEGNTPADLTYLAAGRILAASGLSPEVPLGRGPVSPSTSEGAVDDFHGADGLGGAGRHLPDMPYPKFDAAAALSSPALINETLKNHPPNTVTIVCIASLSNLMEAETNLPGTLSAAKEVIVMAGAFEVPGNITPHAEFNVFHNPESYNFVLKHRDFIFIPLDVTSTILLHKSQVETLQADYGTSKAQQLYQFIEDLTTFQVKQSLAFKQTKGLPAMQMHDPATVAFLIYPNLFLSKRARVEVETSGSFRGKTVYDQRLHASKTTNAWVATTVDATLVLAAFVEDLRVLLVKMDEKR